MNDILLYILLQSVRSTMKSVHNGTLTFLQSNVEGELMAFSLR